MSNTISHQQNTNQSHNDNLSSYWNDLLRKETATIVAQDVKKVKHSLLLVGLWKKAATLQTFCKDDKGLNMNC